VPARSPLAPGVRGVVRHILALLPQLKLLLEQLKQSERRLDRLLQRCAQKSRDACQSSLSARPQNEHSDVEILRSLPGVGRIVCATVLAEAHGVLLQDNRSTLRALGGIAPVTRRSGKAYPVVERRRACNRRVANAFSHCGRTAVQHDLVCRQHYARLRRRGHGHARAVRGVVDRLLDVALQMLKHRTLYDPARRRPLHTVKLLKEEQPPVCADAGSGIGNEASTSCAPGTQKQTTQGDVLARQLTLD